MGTTRPRTRARAKKEEQRIKQRDGVSDANDKRNHMEFPLLDLPPELWINICRLAVTFNDGIKVTKKDYNEELFPTVVSQPAITRTCKAIRKETLHHFYTSNIFQIKDMGLPVDGIYKWLETIGPENCAVLKQVLFHLNGYDAQRLVWSLKLIVDELNEERKRGVQLSIQGFEEEVVMEEEEDWFSSIRPLVYPIQKAIVTLGIRGMESNENHA